MTKRKPTRPSGRTPMQQRAAEAETAKRVAAINKSLAKSGVGQRALAEEAGIAQPHINRILRGHVPTPMFWTLLKIEKAAQYFERLVTGRKAS